jgi:hypothetical protein
MLFELSDSEIRSICKNKLDSLEYWLRRLIDRILSDKYNDYFSYQDEHGNRLFGKGIADSVTMRMTSEPNRYPRKIDAVLLNDAIKIICNDQLFNNHFKEPLSLAFPSSKVTRLFMDRLIAPRNCLAHANPISLRQAEQVICYTGDIIESIKNYYIKHNMETEYNVPLILKATDSFGNSFHNNQCGTFGGGGILKDLSTDSQFYLRPRDTITLEVEIDPSFPRASYEICWYLAGMSIPDSNKPKITIEITEKEVSTQLQIKCNVTTNKDWHRLSGGMDDFLMFIYKVLPPI